MSHSEIYKNAYNQSPVLGDELLDKHYHHEEENGFLSFLGNKIKDILAGDVPNSVKY